MSEYTVVILLALAGFTAVAALLLAPVYVFLRREREASERWTEEAVARRRQATAQRANDAPPAEVEDA